MILCWLNMANSWVKIVLATDATDLCIHSGFTVLFGSLAQTALIRHIRMPGIDQDGNKTIWPQNNPQGLSLK